jgi:hypothetical protein
MTDETTRPGMLPGESRRAYKARLRAMGFEPEPPPIEAIGYGGADCRDPLDWIDQHDEACALRCESTDQVVGRVWVTPDGMVWVRGMHWQGPLDGSQFGGPTNLLLHCPSHDAVLVPARWVEDEARSTRTVAVVQCLDPYPAYRTQ